MYMPSIRKSLKRERESQMMETWEAYSTHDSLVVPDLPPGFDLLVQHVNEGDGHGDAKQQTHEEDIAVPRPLLIDETPVEIGAGFWHFVAFRRIEIDFLLAGQNVWVVVGAVSDCWLADGLLRRCRDLYGAGGGTLSRRWWFDGRGSHFAGCCCCQRRRRSCGIR
jgi:hypothetical protein